LAAWVERDPGLRLAGADMIIGVDTNNDKKTWGERFRHDAFRQPEGNGGDLVPYLVNLTKTPADQIGGCDYTFEWSAMSS
jgi:S-(hydroxymethyl)glutathione dehydrogenase/alcohol dehydrogenase